MAGSPRVNIAVDRSSQAQNVTGKRKHPSIKLEEGTASKKQCMSYTGISTALIQVGQQKTQYHVHRHKLCQVSSFFKAALESGFKEANEQVISLPVENAKVVDRFVQWIYHEKVPDCDASPFSKKDTKPDDGYRNCALYIFADKYGVPELKRYALRNLFQIIGNFGPLCIPAVRTIYDQTGASSGLRRLICDWYAWRICSDSLASERVRALLTEMPEFSADLVVALSRHWRRRLIPKPESLEVSAYM